MREAKMTHSGRANLMPFSKPTPTTHAGLWLDKYIKGFEKEREAKETPQSCLVSEVAGISIPKDYKAYTEFFERWKEALILAGVKDSQMKEAHVQGRLAVGLGGEAVLETAITLHRTYGTPYIPGSALKGLAASYAHKRLKDDAWRKNGEAHNVMFGTTDEAGYVTFFDALFVPGTGFGGKALWPDVITVHHPDYYQGKENSPPADWDSPTPIPFLSATGDYLIALQGDDAWVEKAFEILALALAEEGVGAKTSSGYGRMTLEGITDAVNGPPHGGQAPLDPDQAAIDRFSLRLESMPSDKVAGEIHAVYQEWRDLDAGEDARLRIAQTILQKIDTAGRTKKSVKKKWFQELSAFVNAPSGSKSQ